MTRIIYPECRGETSETETNDCTVRALANATGKSYTWAHDMLSKHGRRFRRGAVFQVYNRAYTEAGATLVGVYGSTKRAYWAGKYSGMQPSAGITLGRMLPRLRTGRWIVLITGHALAVVDGKIIDAGGQLSGSKVFALFKVPTKNQ